MEAEKKKPASQPAATPSSVDTMKSMKELYAMIYGCGKDTIFCPHCGRPMRLEWQDGKRVLICRRCVEQQREDQQEMLDNIVQHKARMRRRLKEHGE
ncbi:MAG: hypothetical protein IJQ98_05525 [Oscillospiraceae bacterium]|nr:hypothetical protein [Oscillospiraceae bacterium]